MYVVLDFECPVSRYSLFWTSGSNAIKLNWSASVVSREVFNYSHGANKRTMNIVGSKALCFTKVELCT